MAQRLELQALLTELLGLPGQVYFQPPPNLALKYPCIIYQRDSVDTQHADNRPYKHLTRYQVTVIDPDPDSQIHRKVGLLPRSSYDRFFAADGLNHDVYNLFF